MKNVIGFGREEEKGGKVQQEVERDITNAPIRSLVQVRFAGVDRCYTYYNDRFDLRPDDMVFVSGKLSDRPGIVESVNYKFKINLADYERVIARPDVKMSGTYFPVMDKMVSYDPNAVSPDTFRSWVKPPIDEDDEDKLRFVMGEGYKFELERFYEDDDVNPEVFQRALDYCNGGRVRYLAVQDGVGTAFVEGSKWYEINFRYEDGYISDLYCECPYSGLCKHNLAVLISLRDLLQKLDKEAFVSINKNFFLRMLSISGQAVTL